MTRQRNRRVLFLGDADYLEFQPAVAWLRESAELTVVDTPQSAIARQSSSQSADIVLIGQTHPGEFSGPAIHRLFHASPLARVLGLFGAWCQGEVRSGKPWSGVERIYWHQWRSRLVAELSDDGPAALPRTADATDALLANSNFLHRRKGLIAIRAQQRSAFEPLLDACRAAGYSTARYDGELGCHVEGPDLLLWDCPLWDDVERRLVREAASQVAAPLLLTMGWPRAEDVVDAQRAGAAAVVSKPLLVEDLYRNFDRLLPGKTRRKVA